jgi:hypothetical protein
MIIYPRSPYLPLRLPSQRDWLNLREKTLYDLSNMLLDFAVKTELREKGEADHV